MAQKLLSILLGSEIVKVCEVALAGKNKVQIFNAIDLIIPEGLCEDGVILDAKGLASAIKEGMAGEGFSSKRIVFTLSSKRIANKEALIPFCKPNKVKDIVKINASEYFPIANLENYTINYSILEVVATEATKNYRLSITATPNDLLEDYYALAKAMGMSVESMDYSGNSILQILKLQTAGAGVDAVLQFSGENTVVNIMKGSTMIMQRSVPYGRVAIVDAVKTYKNCSDEEADEILASQDIERLATNSEDVADAVRALLSSVSRILEFYRNRNADAPIEHVYMIGDVSSINGLVDLIRSEIGGEVSTIRTLRGVEIKNRKSISEEIAANYLANIGAVLEPMNIQLVADKKGSKEGKAGSGKMPWWILIFAGVIAVGMVGGVLFVYNNAKSENDNLQAQIDALGDVESLQQEYERSQADLQMMEDWYNSTKGPYESLYRFITDLETVQPGAVAITHLTAGEDRVTITGESYGKPAVAEYVIQLKKLPYVKNVKTDYVNENLEDYSAKDSFSLTLELQYEDPSIEIVVEPYVTIAPPEDEEGGEFAQDEEFIGEENAEPSEATSDETEVTNEEGGDQ